MPFKSQAQRRWMYANEPAMAKKWQEHTDKDEELPERVKKAYMAGFLKRASEYGLSRKEAEELLEGGIADGMSDSEFPKKELAKGVKHELEHVNNQRMAKEIAKDHLAERTDYYTALDKSNL
jgi:hypothetical protein